MKRLYPIILSFVLFCSCETQSTAIKSNTAKNLQTQKIITNALNKPLSFNNLIIKSKINADIDGTSTKVDAIFYIENQKKVWVNISKFMINGARALITPQEFQAYEKLGKTYIKGDFSYFNELLKVDFIDFQKLENLLLGRVFVEMNHKKFNSSLLDGNYLLSYQLNNILTTKPIKGEYIQSYTFDGDFRLKKAALIEPSTKKELTIEYTNWTISNGIELPKNVKIFVKDKKTQKIELEYNNFAFESMDTPFQIPNGYKQKKF